MKQTVRKTTVKQMMGRGMGALHAVVQSLLREHPYQSILIPSCSGALCTGSSMKIYRATSARQCSLHP